MQKETTRQASFQSAWRVVFGGEEMLLAVGCSLDFESYPAVTDR